MYIVLVNELFNSYRYINILCKKLSRNITIIQQLQRNRVCFRYIDFTTDIKNAYVPNGHKPNQDLGATAGL